MRGERRLRIRLPEEILQGVPEELPEQVQKQLPGWVSGWVPDWVPDVQTAGGGNHVCADGGGAQNISFGKKVAICGKNQITTAPTACRPMKGTTPR